MGEIREFEEGHIPEVAALELKVFHHYRGPASAALQEYFGQIFFRNPWRDDSLPSLVYIDQGKVVGFAGVVPRPMEYNGRKILVGVVCQLMVDTEACRGFAGLKLMKRFLQGPQDLSLTDGGTEAAYAVWTALGAKVAQLYALDWQRILRPARYGHARLSGHPKKGLRAMARMILPACVLTDAALSNMPFDLLSPPSSDLRGQPVGADELLRCVNEISWRDKLKPSYEATSFRWLLDEAAAARNRGVLRASIVCDPKGANAGWYVYYAKPGGVFMVLQIGAAARQMETVLMALFRDAWSQGAVAVRGQVMPRHLLDFHLRHCSFHYPSNGVLVHSRDPQLMACLLEGEAAFTRLDGEWWARFADTKWSAPVL